MKKILSTTLLLVCLLSTSCAKHVDNSSSSSKDNENFVKDYMKESINLLYNNQGNARDYCEKYFLIENESERNFCIDEINSDISSNVMAYKDTTLTIERTQELSLSSTDIIDALEYMPEGTTILTAFSVYYTMNYTIIENNERYEAGDSLELNVYRKGTKRFLERVESF